MLEFPRWKYVVILLVVALSVFYALPNIYPQDPSVQITPNRGYAVDAALRQKVEASLKEAGVATKALDDQDGKSLLVRLPGLDAQTKANDVLRGALGENYVVALNLASTVPDWLSRFGARPMVLYLPIGIENPVERPLRRRWQRQLLCDVQPGYPGPARLSAAGWNPRIDAPSTIIQIGSR